MPPDKMVAYRLQGVVTYTPLIKTFANKIKLESSNRRRSRNQDKIQGKKKSIGQQSFSDIKEAGYRLPKNQAIKRFYKIITIKDAFCQ